MHQRASVPRRPGKYRRTPATASETGSKAILPNRRLLLRPEGPALVITWRAGRLLLMVLSFAVLLGALRYATLPPLKPLAPPRSAYPFPTKYALLIPTQNPADARYVPVQDALQELDFTPLWPAILLPGTHPVPTVSVTKVGPGHPHFDLRYSSPNYSASDPHAFSIMLEQWRTSNDDVLKWGQDAKWFDYRLVSLENVPVWYVYSSYYDRVTPYAEFKAGWEHHGITYQLQVIWAGVVQQAEDTREREQEGFAIIAGLITAADQR